MDDFERWQQEGTSGESTAAQQGFDFFGIVRRRFWCFLLFIPIGLLVGYIVYVSSESRYMSLAQLTVARRGIDESNRSNPVEYEFVRKTDLETQAVKLGAPETVRTAYVEAKLKDLDSLKRMEDDSARLNSIIRGITVSRGDTKYEDADVLNIAFRSSMAEDCPRIINAIIAAYRSKLEGSHKNISAQVKDLYARIKNETEQQLTLIRNEYRKQQAESRYPVDDRNVQIALSFFAAAEQEYTKSDSEFQTLQRTLNKAIQQIENGMDRATVLSWLNSSLPNWEAVSLQEPQLLEQRQMISDRMLTLRASMESKRKELGPKHPDFLAIKAEYDEFSKAYPEQVTGGAAEGVVKKTGPSKGLQIAHPAIAEAVSYQRLYNDGLVGGSFFEEHYVDANTIQEASEKVTRVGPQQDVLDQRINALQLAVETAKQNRDAIYRSYLESQERAKIITQTATALQLLKDEMDEYQMRLQIAVEQLRRIEVLPETAYVVDVITEPGLGRLVSPNLPLNLVLGGVSGLLLGFGLAFLIDRSDRSFRSPDEIRTALGVPVVGHVPVFFPKDEIEDELPGETVSVDPMLCSYRDPDSLAAEAYRAVRTSLYFSTRGESHKVIQVTSPSTEDGKSTLAANLAVSLAQSGVRVLLIDADFRRPRVHQMFGVDKDTGLSQLIRGIVEIPDAVKASEIENLDLLPAGPRPRNPSELLTLPRFKELLATLREKYDFVIVDTPPMLAVTDPAAIAARVDGVLLALQVRRKSRPSTVRAIEILQELGANIIGVVVNGVGWRRSFAYREGGHFGAGSKFYRYSADFRGAYLLGDAYAYSATHLDREDGELLDSQVTDRRSEATT